MALLILTAPYHPQSNGLAERMVQAFKGGMKKLSEGTIDLKLARFLFNYRITPHSTTGMSPSELMFGRQLHTRFDLLQPQLNSKVFKKQQKQKQSFDRHTKNRDFVIGDLVYVRNFSKKSHVKWIPGAVVEHRGNVTFIIHLEDSNNYVKRHKNQMRQHMSDYFLEIEVSLDQTPPPVTHSDNARRYPTRNRQRPQRFAEESWH